MKITGTIIHGKQLGRTLGFPTANLQAEQPIADTPNGVYVAWFDLDGACFPCMVNIGHHPTLPGGGRTVEAHLFSFHGDLYGQRATITLVAHLRDEVKFPSADALRRQLQQDALNALSILNAQASNA